MTINKLIKIIFKISRHYYLSYTRTGEWRYAIFRTIKRNHEPREIALSGKYLRGKYEGLCSDLHTPCKKLGVVVHACNSSCEGLETGRYLELLGQPSTDLEVQRGTLSQKINSGECSRKVSLWSPRIYAQTCAHTYTLTSHI